MVQTFTKIGGAPDFTLPTSPALTEPPLTLLDLSLELVNIEQLTEQLRIANEAAASAQAFMADVITEGDMPGMADVGSDILQDRKVLQAEWQGVADSAEAFASDLADRLAALTRWENGVQYLPELSDAEALETWIQGGAGKETGSNQNPFAWYDAFTVVGHDERSAFGWPATDLSSRAMRATRALRAHRSFQVEQEFWGGPKVPTNYHLTASPETPLTTPNVRTITAWPNPISPPGVALGEAVLAERSLSYLDQLLAGSEAGTGMVHATPFLVQQWMRYFSYIRDSDGKVYTVDHNLIVPGYGYTGMGPDVASLTLADVTFNGDGTISSATGWGDPITGGYNGRPISGALVPAGAIVMLSDANDGQLYVPDPVSGVYVPVTSTATGSDATTVTAGIGGRNDQGAYQWAYCTEQTYSMLGDVYVYPDEYNQQSPLLPVDNSIDVRAEQPAGIVTNRILRGAVLVNIFDS
jgi:hypothetical protein